MYVTIYPERVERLGGHPAVAYFVAWLDFRTRMNHEVYERDGHRWWRITQDEMASEMGVSRQTVRTMIEHAKKYHAVVEAEHQTRGWRDRGKSYAVEPGFRSIDGLGEINRCNDRLESTAVPSLPKEETNTVATLPAKKKKVYSKEFDLWWSRYPKRVNKKLCSSLFEETLTKIDLDSLLSATDAYASEMAKGDPKWIKYPQGWLNDERWRDYLPSKAAAGVLDSLIAAADFPGLNALGVSVSEPLDHVELGPRDRHAANVAWLEARRSEFLAQI